jgi:hypothetical protein
MFNPFYWNPWSELHSGWASGWLAIWNGLVSYLPIITLIYFCFSQKPLNIQSLWRRILLGAPLGAFIMGLKILNWGQFWYALVFPAFVLPLRLSTRLILILFAIYFLMDGRSLLLLLGRPLWGVGELASTVDHFRSCLWTCDYRSIGPVDISR